jgi:dienelactone hydrolase
MISRHSSSACVAAALIAMLLTFDVGDAVAADAASIAGSKISLPVGGKTISAEVFEQAPAGKKPVVLVLHGAGGTLFDGPEMRRVAQHLAAEGNAVYLVRYFESTGTIFALDSSMQRHFGTWRRTVTEAIPAIQRLRGDRSPVGVFGYSLGGFLAVFTASDNANVAAVAELAGGVWNGKMDRVGKLPPVLMIHGEQDGRVPFAKYAKPLEAALRARRVNLQTRFFPQEAHVFTPAAMQEVRTATAAFFRKHLPRRS